MRNYDIWRTDNPYDHAPDHPDNCRCPDCAPDWHRDLAMDADDARDAIDTAAAVEEIDHEAQ